MWERKYFVIIFCKVKVINCIIIGYKVRMGKNKLNECYLFIKILKIRKYFLKFKGY